MLRKSFRIPLALAVAVCFASLVVTPAALASPAQSAAHQATLHSATQQHVTQRNAALVYSACPSGQTMRVTLSDNSNYPSVYDNYFVQCIAGDPCGGYPAIYSWVCLYQNSNYGGQEIVFEGYGCANLTDFAGPGSHGTWNDAMSSFKSVPAAVGNPLGGAFWWNTNDGLYYYLFGYPGSGRVTSTPYIGSTWNDQASSLQLDPNPGSC